MKKFFDVVALIRWLWSTAYEKTLSRALHPGFRKELMGVCATAKTRFPFLNNEYFGSYEDVKRDSKKLWGVDVKEVDLPDELLGAYVPQSTNGSSIILINKRRSPLFYLTTLAHELSHVPVYQYMQKTDVHSHDEVRVRNRVALFAEALRDPEEILPDVLTTLGAYPRPDFERGFVHLGFGPRAVLKALVHLPRHYPELIRGILRGRDLLLNFALLVHFLKLRFFLYDHYDL